MQIKITTRYCSVAKSRTHVLSVGVDLGRKRSYDVHCWWWERKLASALQKGRWQDGSKLKMCVLHLRYHTQNTGLRKKVQRRQTQGNSLQHCFSEQEAEGDLGLQHQGNEWNG